MSAQNRPSIQPFREVFTAEMDLAYQVKLLRIRQGWTPGELSFLIGRPPSYINERENLVAGKSFTLSDLFQITRAVKQSTASLIMSHPRQQEKICLRVTVQAQQSLIIHDFWQKLPEGRSRLVCRLYEYEKQAGDNLKKQEAKQVKALAGWLGRLISRGYFSEQYHLALDLYLLAGSRLRTTVRPCLLEEALSLYTAGNQYPRLVRYRQKQVGYVYQWMTSHKKLSRSKAKS
jgi:transcriptional regulator with XRE-family HTH domain